MSAPDRSTRVFLSFPEVVDTGRHHDYNAWHQLDHRPENLALPGVVHGERWVRTPQCRDASGADVAATLSAAQYLAMYWFREPAPASIAEWSDLGDTTLQQGRRPELAWTQRRLTGMFRPVQGWVDPAAGISLSALPFRPVRGVLAEVHRVDEPGSATAERAFAHLHTVRVPSMLALPGVVGAWTFASRQVSLVPVDGDDVTVLAGAGDPGRLRVTLYYCEADPVDVAPALEGLIAADPDRPGIAALLRSPYRTITPWQWDWFAGAAGG